MKAGEAHALSASVNADDGYRIISRNPATVPNGVTAAGSYSFALGAGLGENTYTFQMQGTYRPAGGGGDDDGPPVDDLAWNVSTRVAVANCAYEASGKEAANPPGTLEIIDDGNGGVKTYSVNVTADGNHTIFDLFNALRNPQGSTPYTLPLTGSEWATLQSVEQCPSCEAPIHKYKVWYSKIKLTLKYEIEMPSWTQHAQAGPQAQVAWNAYYAALKAHEDYHVTIIQDYFNGPGKAALEQYAKDAFWGMAHNSMRAWNLALTGFNADFNKIFADHKALHFAYDALTDGGKNQAAVNGTNIVLGPSNLKLNE